MIKATLSKTKKILRNLLLSHATPHEVAMGFAIGMFISCTPLVGFHTVLAIALAAFLKENKVSAVIGTWLNNPLTLVPTYYVIYNVGLFLTRNTNAPPLHFDSVKDVFNMGSQILIPLTVGGIFVGLLSALISYYLVKALYPYLHRKKDQFMHYLHEKKQDHDET